MSGEGHPELNIDGTGLKVTIVSGLWHHQIAEGLLAADPGLDQAPSLADAVADLERSQQGDFVDKS